MDQAQTDLTLKMASQIDFEQQWIGDEPPKYDPAWAFRTAMMKHHPPPASERLEKHKHKFQSFMSEFWQSYQDKDANPSHFDSSTTWEEVRKEAAAAFEEYINQGRSWRHPFRTGARYFGKAACRIEFLVELIPDGDYLGILCGGLKLVFNAAKRKKEIRELIIQTLDSLSDSIEGPKLYIRMYASDEDIRKKMEDLYIAILDAVEAITVWLKQSVVGAAVKAIIKQNDYGKELKQKLKANIEDKSIAFDAAVTKCLHGMVHLIHHNILVMGHNMNSVMTQISSDTEALAKGYVALNFLEEQLQSMSKDIKWQFDVLEERRRASIEEIRNASFGTTTIHVTNIMIPQFQQSYITASELLTILGLELTGSSDDPLEQASERIRTEREFVTFMGRRIDHRRLGGVSFIMNDSQFQNWYKSMDSQTIIVHGMAPSFDPSEIVSPFSYMCTMLAQIIMDHNHSYPLSFFCRLHDDPEDRAQGPSGIIRSLTAQLTLVLVSLYSNPDLSFIGPEEVAAIQAQNLPSLCRLFEELLKRVEVGVIICLLDWESWFENETHLSSMHIIMQFFNSLVKAVERAHSGIVFKFLIANPLTSQYCRDWFPDGINIYAPAEGLVEAFGVNEIAMSTIFKDSI